MGVNFEVPEAERAGVRAVVATIDRQIAHLPRLAEQGASEKHAAVDELSASWAQLVTLLALGPAPKLRECPACQRVGMRAATRCGYCWTKLSPLAAAASGEADAPAEA